MKHRNVAAESLQHHARAGDDGHARGASHAEVVAAPDRVTDAHRGRRRDSQRHHEGQRGEVQRHLARLRAHDRIALVLEPRDGLVVDGDPELCAAADELADLTAAGFAPAICKRRRRASSPTRGPVNRMQYDFQGPRPTRPRN